MQENQVIEHTAATVARIAPVDAKEVVAQVKAIQMIMSQVMKDGTHYGILPSTKTPTLYKAGSEALLSAFKISVEPQVEAIRHGDHISYRVSCIGRHIPTGLVVGVGIGEASTAEEKYSWRAAVCQEEYEDTPETHRRKKWKKGYNNQPPSCEAQVRTNAADLANTVLKMAKKRAQIDLTLTSLAASDIFTQDLEDLPPEYLEGMTPEEQQAAISQHQNRYKVTAKTQGNAAPAQAGAATEKQVALVRQKMGFLKIPEADACQKFGIPNLESLPKNRVNEFLAWIGAN